MKAGSRSADWHQIFSYPVRFATQAELMRRRKGLKKGSPMFVREEDEDPTSYHRRTHTANERRRRNEMRDLFEELKNSLGLHNLPKVSKSYILKQAIEEIEGLSDEADTLIRKKTLLSQKQNQLIKKVSNISGRPREVIVKKLEYIDAKQKAIEAERKKKQLDEDMALHKAMLRCNPSHRVPIHPLNLQEEPSAASGRPKKPLILRKQNAPPAEASPSQPLVSSISPSPGASREVQPSVAIKSQPQTGPGLAPVTVPLPVALHDGDPQNPFSAPVILADPDFSEDLTPTQDSDDLSMMPKIVNVTSLATDKMMDDELEHTALIDQHSSDDTHFPSTAAIMKENEPAHDVMPVITLPDTSATATTPGFPILCTPALPSISKPQSTAQESFTPGSVETLSTKDCAEETVAGCEGGNVKPPPVPNLCSVDTAIVPDLDFKKVASAVDDPVLDPSELIDVIGDHEDESLTSLLNEIVFLNQQLNNDIDELDSGTDFPGSDTASRSSTSKLLDGDASPFSFGPELSGMKEKVSLSPLFLQLEEGEIQEDLKQKEDTLPANSNTVTLPEIAASGLGLQEENDCPPESETAAKQELPGCDAWWRPMPKLAPLGLKAVTASPAHTVVASKAMPALAPVAKMLTSPLAAEGQSLSVDSPLANNPEK